MALYRSADILRASNKNLFHHLEHSSDAIKGVSTLYKDIIEADRNISIVTKHKFHQIIIIIKIGISHLLFKMKKEF